MTPTPETAAATHNHPPLRRAAVLLAKSSITGASEREMQTLAERLAATGLVQQAVYAFSEQGLPTLREVLLDLVNTRPAFDEVLLLPWSLPTEPGFRVWIEKVVRQWQAAASSTTTASWPPIRIAPPPASSVPAIDALAQALVQSSTLSPPIALLRTALPPANEGSTVPPQQRRVLVCQGGPCNNAGAAIVWGHLRNEQKRLDLRTTGIGVMSAKTSCLGPCNLAPVLQVFPEGTYYGGVDEAGIDQIISRHLQGGCVVKELAYAPLPEKQRLRV